MRVNFSQYVEGEKLSVSSFMLSLINLGQNEKISTKKINDKKHIEEKEREEVVQEIMSKKQQELVNQLIEFLQSNKHIKELSLQDSWYCTRTIETLAQSSSLQNLRKLNLNLEDIDVEAIKTLAKSPHLQNLEKLIIHSRSIDCKIVEAIAELRDHRIEFDKLFSNEYQIFYRFLLSKVYFDNQIAGEKDVEKMVMGSALFDPRGKVIEYILENPDRYPLSINSQDRIPGKPLLHFAARMGMLELVKILMRNGEDVNTTNDGETPLHLAAKYVYTKPMLDLIKIGLSINSINAYNLARKRNATEVVQALIKAGADINAVNRTGETPLTTADNAKNTDLSRLIVNHITKLEAIELYISDQNLQKKNEFINSSEERKNYCQHSQKCEKEVQKIKERNEPLYDFLRESDVNKMVDIWEKNENVRNEFDNEKGLKGKYPEYADILINKANKVKKEIFLHNQKPLIHWLQAYYKCNFRAITFSGICSFFDKRKQDKIFKKYPMRLGSIMGRFNSDRLKYLIDCEERSCPKLSVQTAKYCIKNKLLEGNLCNPNIEQLPAVSQACFSDEQVSPPTNDAPRSKEKNKLPTVCAFTLVIAGIVSGIAIAFYSGMLAVGIAVGVCCLIAAAVIYCCNSPSNLLKDSNVEIVVNQVTVA